MVQLLQDLADKFADFAQGMVRGNPLLRMNVRKHPALILRSSAHLQPSRRIRGALNHHSFALARFFSKLLEPLFLCSRFMIWRWILTTNKKGEQKWTKPPFCAADPGRHAANDRPETWSR